MSNHGTGVGRSGGCWVAALGLVRSVFFFFLSWQVNVFGFWFSGFWEREGEEQRCRGRKTFFPKLCTSGKKKIYNAFQNDTVLVFFLTVDETMQFCPKHVVSFKRKWRQDFVNFQINPQFVNCSIKSSVVIFILRIDSIASFPKSDISPKFGCLIQFDHWSWIYAI